MRTFFTIMFICARCDNTPMSAEFRTDEIFSFEHWYKHKSVYPCQTCWDKTYQEYDMCRKHIELEKSEKHPMGYFGACKLGYNHSGECQPYECYFAETPEELEEQRQHSEFIDRQLRAHLDLEELERFDALRAGPHGTQDS